ncbi:MAG: hypothetical protein LBD12_06800 [Clostridiales Family XIII bacterium]|jgi:hypothetical protein|nr:hypothetical protein [Clostridiales Family XIII bacterium]
MACFVVPGTEAIVTTIMQKAVASKAKRNGSPLADGEQTDDGGAVRIPFARKLRWLNNLLWGGSALLAFEHVWHGEVTPWFPFLTAAADQADTAEMLHEMATAGVSMAVIVTVVWLGLVVGVGAMEKRELRARQAAG